MAAYPKLSERHTIDDLDIGRLPKYELFIGACGGDDRSYQWLARLSSAGRLTDSFLFDYRQRHTRRGSDRYYGFRAYAKGAQLIACSTVDETCDMRMLIRKAGELGSLKRVALDISVFTKPFFFAVLRALKDFLHVETVDVLYTEPGSYLKSHRSREYDFSGGVYRPIEVPGFSGVRMARSKRLLIMLLGFEGTAARTMWDELAPTGTVLVNGFPAYLLHYKDTSLLNNEPLISAGEGEQLAFAPANDPYETCNVIDGICDEHRDYAITIAPLGPKPMALGAAIYALQHPEIRISYPMPRNYSNVVSRDCGVSWHFPLQFN